MTQNINSDNQRAFLNVCGMDQHALMHPTKADCGHMIVADLLMNIRQITEMDEPFLSFLHSPSALQLIEMSAIEPK